MEMLTIIAPDRIGLLLEITESLGRERINIESISLEVVGRKAVVRLIIDKKRIADAKAIFEKRGFHAVESDTFIVKITNKPGELSKIAKALAEGGVSVENVHFVDKQSRQALCAIRVDNPKKAEKLLMEYM